MKNKKNKKNKDYISATMKQPNISWKILEIGLHTNRKKHKTCKHINWNDLSLIYIYIYIIIQLTLFKTLLTITYNTK